MGVETSSIHHQRRWYYVAWITLLVGSLVLLGLWMRPSRQGQASLTINMAIKDLPQGTRAQVWIGPKEQWTGAGWNGAGAAFDQVIPVNTLNTTPMAVPLAYRRWMKGRIYIPSRTADLAVIRLLAPGQAPRYMAFSLQNDIYTGLLRPKGKISYKMEATWAGFSPEATRAPKVI